MFRVAEALDMLFQFLIGALQTNNGKNRDCKCKQVSIPYRSATNILELQKTKHGKLVSIPYRSATNYIEPVVASWTVEVSIPYRSATNYLGFLSSHHQ